MSVRDYTKRYIEKDNRIASISYFGTFVVYFLTLYLAVHFASVWWAVGPFIVVNGFAAVRLYVLQHDTGHASLFVTRRQNDLAGFGLSVFTLTPYWVMRHNHNLHHAHVGNLEHREDGEVFTMTLSEWQSSGRWQKIGYRFYRNPFVMLLLGGVYVYILRYRWPKNTQHAGVWGVVAHNICVGVWLFVLWLLGGMTALSVWLATAVVAGAVGVFLVYLQHNFEDTYWDRRPDLDPSEAALKGSSALDLGWLWDLGTGNIAYHDIHHFDPRIPSYRLRKCHREISHVLAPQMNIIRWPQAIAAFRLKLWDEETRKLVGFPGRPAGLVMP